MLHPEKAIAMVHKLIHPIIGKCARPVKAFMCCLLLLPVCTLSSCYSYRLATHSQPSTDRATIARVHACSLFWGIINKPQVITTPSCDALGATGVSEVSVKTSFGNAFLTVITLGIYCPVIIEWKCAKPCQQTGEL